MNDTVKDKKAGDAARNDTAGTKEPATSTPPTTTAAERRWRWPTLAAVLMIGAAATVYWYWWGSGASATSTVNVTLKEWSVTLDAPSAAAGLVKFKVRNDGPSDTHEFVVVKTDLAPDALPVDANGMVDENGAGIEIIGEIEDIPVRTDTHLKAFDLAPGNYVLICNIYDAGEKEAHYHKGMRVAFTVTGN